MTARAPRGSRPAPASAAALAARADRLAALLRPVVEPLDLEAVELRTVGRRLVVRVLVDGDHGVTLDEVAVASRAASEALDASDVLGDDPYTLEVSSPGVDRPLTEARHWRRSVGRLVCVTTTDAREITGRVLSLDGDAVELEVNAKGRITRTSVPLHEVARAVVQVEFSRVADAELEPIDDDDPDDEHDVDQPDEDEHDALDDGTDPESEA